jgi:hypothetical protein
MVAECLLLVWLYILFVQNSQSKVVESRIIY